MKMRKLLTMLIILSSFSYTAVSLAEVAVIMHPSSGVASMTSEEVSRIFLGKTNSFPDGVQAIPINQNEGSPVRDKFNEVVCKKNRSQYRAFWSQLVFTGKGTPPKDAGKDAEIKELIAANPNMIGYVNASAVDSSVKVVFKLP